MSFQTMFYFLKTISKLDFENVAKRSCCKNNFQLKRTIFIKK